MHAAQVLRRCLSKALDFIHRRRLVVLLGAVHALIEGQRLTLMDLARSWPDAERVAAPLKKLDRLLGNVHLHDELAAIYAAITAWCTQALVRPVIIVDWSDLDRRGRYCLLRAALAVGGRSLTLWECVCPMKHIGSPRVQNALLRALRAAMPSHVRPILVTDAGFMAPWFEAVTALGWDYVGRLRNRMLVKPSHVPDLPGEWLPCRALYELVVTAARDLGMFDIACRLVVYRAPKKGRVHRNRSGARARSKRSQANARREAEPWLLAVSPSLGLSANAVVKLYARRMQIEQSFRDLKSHRYGVGFEDSQTRSAPRLAVLLLIQALVGFLAWYATRTASVVAYRSAVASFTRVVASVSHSWHRVGVTLLRRQHWRPNPTTFSNTPLELLGGLPP
jgi:hypothetical protein